MRQYQSSEPGALVIQQKPRQDTPKNISPQHDKKSNKINSHELPVNALERLRVFMAIQAKRKGWPKIFSLYNGKGRIAIAWPSVLYGAKR